MGQRWQKRVGKFENRDSASPRGVMILISLISLLLLPLWCIYSQNNRRVVLEKENTSALKGKDPFEMHNMGLSTYWKTSSSKYLICLYLRFF